MKTLLFREAERWIAGLKIVESRGENVLFSAPGNDHVDPNNAVVVRERLQQGSYPGRYAQIV
jgi:hypothetical protein